MMQSTENIEKVGTELAVPLGIIASVVKMVKNLIERQNFDKKRVYSAVISFYQYLNKNKNLAQEKNKDALCFALYRSIEMGLNIDGNNVWIFSFNGGKPEIYVGYKGLMCLIARNIPEWSCIQTRVFTNRELDILADKGIEELPKLNQPPSISYIREARGKVTTIKDVAGVMVYFNIVCRNKVLENEVSEISNQYYLATDLRERVKGKNTACWTGKDRLSDPIEMLRKTAIRHFCKDLPNMPQYIQDIA